MERSLRVKFYNSASLDFDPFHGEAYHPPKREDQACPERVCAERSRGETSGSTEVTKALLKNNAFFVLINSTRARSLPRQRRGACGSTVKPLNNLLIFSRLFLFLPQGEMLFLSEKLKSFSV